MYRLEDVKASTGRILKQRPTSSQKGHETLTNTTINWPLTIHTDPEATIAIIERLQQPQTNRELLQTNNLCIRLLLRKLLAERQAATKLVKVNAHAGIELNERADKIDKEAAFFPSKRRHRYEALFGYRIIPEIVLTCLYGR
ncbi:hypothetical protein ROZALSC1DRAFT_22418 [Rozella allomycis CSF55]|uniref:RNase H type-1 domain-containing protein n=1 Tax=Rozella allomycis (strain CSF55) TaxID=988480 RepID=A0A4P9YIS4_ROZAC|nr:hypothetical protein ROZALSC1DRAFT_22418 [Rozella allomycis CSF55]